jgi:hypothetical protein
MHYFPMISPSVVGEGKGKVGYNRTKWKRGKKTQQTEESLQRIPLPCMRKTSRPQLFPCETVDQSEGGCSAGRGRKGRAEGEWDGEREMS